MYVLCAYTSLNSYVKTINTINKNKVKTAEEFYKIKVICFKI